MTCEDGQQCGRIMAQTTRDVARNGVLPEGVLRDIGRDLDPQETQEWLDSLEYVIQHSGCERGAYLLERLKQRAFACGVQYPGGLTTPYVNTIPPHREPEYPGDRAIERRIKSLLRWNAMAMVVRANRAVRASGAHFQLCLGRHAV